MSNGIQKLLASCAASVLLPACLSACGGASGEAGNRVAGVEGTGAREGSISGFGSIFINGEEINTDGARIIIDGQQATEADLIIGMKVRATVAESQSDRASRVEFNRYLRGPVESVNYEEGRITSLSQTVRFNDTTVFHNIDHAQDQQLNPANNEMVTVSGFVNRAGEIVATLLSRADRPYDRDTSAFDLEGSVSSFNSLSKQFRIGALLVDFSLANVDESVGQLEDGAIVEAFGTQVNFQGVLLASDVRVITRKISTVGHIASLEGIVTANNVPGQFHISDQVINTSGATRQDNSADNPTVGSRIQVFGRIDADGILQAQSLKVIPDSTNELSGAITLLSDKRLQILDTTIQTDASTIYQDSSSSANRRLRYESLANGDKITTTGYLDKDGLLVATSIQRFDSDGEASVTGELQACNSITQTLQIANVSINTDGNTTFRHNDHSESFFQFCASTPIGSQASARGQQNGDSLNASEVSSRNNNADILISTPINIDL